MKICFKYVYHFKTKKDLRSFVVFQNTLTTHFQVIPSEFWKIKHVRKSGGFKVLKD